MNYSPNAGIDGNFFYRLLEGDLCSGWSSQIRQPAFTLLHRYVNPHFDGLMLLITLITVSDERTL